MSALDTRSILNNTEENAVLFKISAPGDSSPTEVNGLLFKGETKDTRMDGRRDFVAVATAHIPKESLEDPKMDSQVTVDGETYTVKLIGEIGEAWVLHLGTSTVQLHARGVRL